MTDYFVLANSKPAPHFPDTSHHWQDGDDPEAALDAFVGSYDHPYGLDVAEVYTDANAYYRGKRPLAVCEKGRT